MSLKKKVGITGLNTSHIAYSKVNRFILFDAEIRDLVSNQIYSSTAAVVNDAELGDAVREFDASVDVMSPSVPVTIGNSVMLVYRSVGPSGTGISFRTEMLKAELGGNSFYLESGIYTTYDYRVTRRGSYGTTYVTNYKPYNASGGLVGLELRKQPHATLLDYVSGSSSFWQNGSEVPVHSGPDSPVFTPSINPVQAAIGTMTASTQASWRCAAIVVFSEILTSEEKSSVTLDPWDLVVGSLPLEVSISSTLTPAATITATLTNFLSTPTTVTVEDTVGNTLVLPLTDIGSNQVTFTVPKLPSVDGSIDYIQFGNVNLTFGDKTITSTFSVPSGKDLVTLIDPVSQYVFGEFPVDPASGDQIISTLSEGTFDNNGNFTTDADGNYRIWCVYANGTLYSNSISTSLEFNQSVVPSYINITAKSLQLVVGNSFSGDVSPATLAIISKSLSLSSGTGFVQSVLPYSMTITPKPLQFVSFRNIPLDSKRIYFIR